MNIVYTSEHIRYSKNIDTTVPTKTIQIISTFKSRATNAAAASKTRGMSHEIFDAKRKVTVSRSPTKEHKIARIALLK
jgi:hypothetical protein